VQRNDARPTRKGSKRTDKSRADSDRDLKPTEIPATIKRLQGEMHKFAEQLEFERAADLRDRIRLLQERALLVG